MKSLPNTITQWCGRRDSEACGEDDAEEDDADADDADEEEAEDAEGDELDGDSAHVGEASSVSALRSASTEAFGVSDASKNNSSVELRPSAPLNSSHM